MRIYLIYPPVDTYEMPTLGLPYLKSYLREDYDVRLMDLNLLINNPLRKEILKYSDSIDSVLKLVYQEYFSLNDDVFSLATELRETVNEWVTKILNFEPDVIGFYVMNSTQLMSLLLAKKIKEVDNTKTIVFGGPNCNSKQMAMLYLEIGFVDVVIKGEGEVTLYELLKSLEKKGKVENVLGCIVKSNGKVIDWGERPLIKNLDDIPFPDFSDLPLKRYALPGILPILTSRGCVGNCTFCSEKKQWKIYRERSVDNIIEEFKHGWETYGINAFRMNDSLINGNVERLSKLCDKIIRAKLEISWFGNARISGMNKNLLEKMYKAGCRILFYGIESGSQRVLNMMHKNTDVKNIDAILQWTKESGIHVHIYLIAGFPGETIKDLKDTLNLFIRNKHNIDTALVHPCNIGYHSDLRQNPDKYGIKILEKEVQLPKQLSNLRKYIYPSVQSWETNRNTESERKRRASVLTKALKDLDKPPYYPLAYFKNTTIPFEAIPHIHKQIKIAKNETLPKYKYLIASPVSRKIIQTSQIGMTTLYLCNGVNSVKKIGEAIHSKYFKELSTLEETQYGIKKWIEDLREKHVIYIYKPGEIINFD